MTPFFPCRVGQDPQHTVYGEVEPLRSAFERLFSLSLVRLVRLLALGAVSVARGWKRSRKFESPA